MPNDFTERQILEILIAMRDSKPTDLNLCLNCRRRLRTCVCQLIRPFDTDSRFIILMHPMEYKKEKVGTGRFSHLILRNSEIIVDVNFDENPRFQELLADPSYQSFILYPGEDALDLSGDSLSRQLKCRAQFFVIDGTWPCAKKMMKLTTSLHSLPRVSFQAQIESAFIIKHQPVPGCLSTVESIYQLITELERMGIEKKGEEKENLNEVFSHTVQKQLDLINDSNENGYRKSGFLSLDKREVSKKWSKRSLFFN